MKRIEDVYATEEGCLARIIHRRLRTHLQLQTPVAIRQRGSARHRFQRRLILFHNVFVFQILVWSSPVQDCVSFLRLLLGDSRVLHLSEG
jgi:hypothetical protein